MNKVLVDWTDATKLTAQVLSSYGALLVANDRVDKPNVMTIGWATWGIIWGKPIMTVLVHPSRYTYQFIEQADSFTVNLPPLEMADVATFCGTVSGRDYDKFKEKNLTAVRGKRVSASYIDECIVHFECRIVFRNYVTPDMLSGDITAGCYANGDFHTIYYGEIVGCYANETLQLGDGKNT